MTRRVFWTGGFDSTFRVLDLLRRGECVETLYLAHDDPHWNKRVREVDSRDRIAHALPREYRRRLIVRPPESSAALGTRTSELIHEHRWTAYYEQTAISPQNALLVAGAEGLGTGIEVMLTASDGQVRDAAVHELAMRLRSPSKFIYPLVSTTKEQMLAHARRNGFAHLLMMTWSCEEAEGATACERCASCRARIVPAAAFGSTT